MNYSQLSAAKWKSNPNGSFMRFCLKCRCFIVNLTNAFCGLHDGESFWQHADIATERTLSRCINC